MKQIVKIARTLAPLTLLLLGGCSALSSIPIPGLDYIAGEEGLLRDQQGDYLEAQVLPRTQIPPEYDSYIIDDLMVIPPINTENTQAYLQAPRPRPFSGRSDRGVVIQRMNDENWVVVDVGPSEVWPRIRDYWTRQGIEIDSENPTRGVMETSWFVLEGNTLTKEKMRITVEPGFQNDSAEIRMRHLSIGQSIPAIGSVNWPDKSTDPDVEFDFLTDLSNYLADVADLYQASTVSFLAENISGQGKASIIETPGGKELLHLRADYSRSWAAIGRALERKGVDIVADSVEDGVYEVEYVIGADNEEKKPGFFKKVITLNGLLSRENLPRNYSLRVRVLDLDGEVDVIVESLEPLPQPDTELQEIREAESSLLRLISTSIA